MFRQLLSGSVDGASSFVCVLLRRGVMVRVCGSGTGYVYHMNLPFMGRRADIYHVTSCLAALQ
jgi:hypothetical protein